MEPLSRPWADLSDCELIRIARRRPAAFEALFERHAAPLRGWLLAQTRNPAVSHDLLAETFAQAWKSAPRFRGTDARSGVSWLYGIARHLLHQHYRKGRVETSARKRLQMTTTPHDDGGIDDASWHVDAESLSAEVREFFALLTDDQRAAIGYRVVDELSYEEISLRLGCTPETARTRVFRGLQTMRSAIAKGGNQ
ncbi:MAG TPA: RNA polymerase sigma factor [Solirubrobacteraceae bacterium]|jgi:RNA polymerase sigma-70 factor (ECF subfamily)|nr:RNA polymerase sigma factor [Solirubrobacteraceae bacterium]